MSQSAPLSAAPVARGRVLRIAALATTALYLGWRVTTLGHHTVFNAALLVLELWGAFQLLAALGAKPAARRPGPGDQPEPSGREATIVVTLTHQDPEALERTLIGCRSVRGAAAVIVAGRVQRPGIAPVLAVHGARSVAVEGNHVDAWWGGVRATSAPHVAWLEAGQIPMPDLIESTIGRFDDPSVALVQSCAGLLNDDSLAHLRNGRDESAFRDDVLYPALGREGLAPWLGGGSVVRTDAIASVGGPDRDDRAALQRLVVRLQADAWRTELHQGHPLIHTTAPDTLDDYLRLRRRNGIESMRVFVTPESPVRYRGLSWAARSSHFRVAALFGTGVRQLLLTLVLATSLLTGALPVGPSALTWFAWWAPALVAGTLARRATAAGTMRIGDWTRQGWRTMAADASALWAVFGLGHGRRAAATDTQSTPAGRVSGLKSLSRLRLLTGAVVVLDIALLARAVTLVRPDALPRFSPSARILAMGLAVVVLASMIDVLQMTVRRRQRRSSFRLATDLNATLGARDVKVVDLSPAGLGCIGTVEVPVGTEGPVVLQLPQPDGTIETCTLRAVVRATDARGDGRTRLGMEFTDVPTPTRSALVAYCAIAHHRDADVAPTPVVTPAEFKVSPARHPKLMQTLSGVALFLGAATIVVGPSAVPAFADESLEGSVCLSDSAGKPVAGGEASFYWRGAWTVLGTTDESGCAVGALPDANASYAMTHRGVRATLTQDARKAAQVDFATKPVTVGLFDSRGAPIPGGLAHVYAGGRWTEFGKTDDKGQATIELLPATLSFSITHDGFRNTAQVNTNQKTDVGFSTTSVKLSLRDSNDKPLAGAVAEYYANGRWNVIDKTDEDGVVTIEMLPATASFAVTHNGLRNTRQNNTALFPGVEFQTTSVTVGLVSSTGQPISGAVTEYYAGGRWNKIGETDRDGKTTLEILPATVSFAVTHDGLRNTRQQNIAVERSVKFSTVAVAVSLTESTGVPIEGAVAEYYSEGRWKVLGRTTADGTAGLEILPGTTSFGITHEGLRRTVQAKTATDPVVEFETIPVSVTVHRSDGSPVEGASTEYYGGGRWKPLGRTDADGRVTIELLPATISFAATLDGLRNTQRINSAVDAVAAFQTVPVVADDGERIVEYYAGGWKRWVDGTEFLPSTVTFRVGDASTHRFVLAAGTEIAVPSGTVRDLAEPEPEPEAPVAVATPTPAPTAVAIEATPTPVLGSPVAPTAQPTPTATPGTTAGETDADGEADDEDPVDDPDDGDAFTIEIEATPTPAPPTGDEVPATATPATAAAPQSDDSVAPPAQNAAPPPAADSGSVPPGAADVAPVPDSTDTRPLGDDEPVGAVTSSEATDDPAPGLEPVDDLAPTALDTADETPSSAPRAAVESTTEVTAPTDATVERIALQPRYEATAFAAGTEVPLTVSIDPAELRRRGGGDIDTIVYGISLDNETEELITGPVAVDLVFESAVEVRAADSDTWTCSAEAETLRCFSSDAILPGQSTDVDLAVAAPTSPIEVGARNGTTDVLVIALAAAALGAVVWGRRMMLRRHTT